MVTYATCSALGQRECNEDSFGVFEMQGTYCFMVADGLGGHGGGEYAAAIAKEAVEEKFANIDRVGAENFLSECFLSAQENVMVQQKKDEKKRDMKTTMVELLIRDHTAMWGHIGDSRLYHFHGKRLVERTLDHSVPQMLVNMGEIKEKDIRGHEDRNRILRVIGSPWRKSSYTLSNKTMLHGFDAFLLCTDGFWEWIAEKKMTTILKKSATVEEWLDRMREEVRKTGQDKDMDNNTAVAIWVEDER